jgi:tyrosine-protein phosphatase YwqE
VFLFQKKNTAPACPLTCDLHSHLLPGIDDGVKTIDEALAVIDLLRKRGIRKCITTPHVMADTYPNTPETIAAAHQMLQEKLPSDFTLEVAAEYYLDEALMTKVVAHQPLLTFGKKNLLFELNFITEPFVLKEFIFNIATQGYTPVLAHPERYQYITQKKVEDLLDRGVQLQLNALSLIGFYSEFSKKFAERLIDQKAIAWVGTDCHNEAQAHALKDAQETRAYKRALDLPLLNFSL